MQVSSAVGRGIPLRRAVSIVQELKAIIKPKRDTLYCAGSIRREKAFIGDIDLVLCGEKAPEALKRLKKYLGDAQIKPNRVIYRFMFKGV